MVYFLIFYFVTTHFFLFSDGIPLLEVQYQFQSEDLSENGREAYRRLTAIADIGVTKRYVSFLTKKKHHK